jgi:uncharacterized protein (DUF934 family)
MPRRLLRDRHIVLDDWRYLAEVADAAAEAAPPGGAAARPAREGTGPLPALIVPFDTWRDSKQQWLARGGRLGVMLAPAHNVMDLAPDLDRLALVAAQFPGPSEGRGYSQARLLRERLGFLGELRATGYVRRDQLFFLARCGFNSFELPDSDIEDARVAFSTFTAAYQPSNDFGLIARAAPPDTPASGGSATPRPAPR